MNKVLSKHNCSSCKYWRQSIILEHTTHTHVATTAKGICVYTGKEKFSYNCPCPNFKWRALSFMKYIICQN